MKRLINTVFFLLILLGVKAEGVYSLIFNEVMGANIDLFVDPSWNFGGWVEFYNPTNNSVQMQGCWLSDDPNNLKKRQITQSTIIEPKSHKVLWFDHHDKYCLTQVNMKMDADGGTLYFSSNRGVLIKKLEYPPSIPRASYARLKDGSGEWGWTNTPTPETSNDSISHCAERLPAPDTDKPSQIFRWSLVTNVTNIPEGAILRFTMDGSTPTMENGYSSSNGRFVISSSKVYRMAFFKDGYLMSPVVTRSYIKKDMNFTLPVMSVAAAPSHLTGAELGIFVKGVNGRPGLGQSTPCNWNMEWDRPCNFELLDTDGNLLINQEAEMSRCGGWSRGNTPYSFKVHAAKVFEGNSHFNYQFFANKPFLKHKMLQIRNGGNDTQYRITDAFIQELVQTSGLDVDGQSYQPVAHYINGEYKGVINIREPNNKQFIYANYGLEDTEIDLFEINADSGYCQMYGTPDAFEELYQLTGNAADEQTYEKICQKLDIDEFCNYMACQMYLGNWDWPMNNLKAWRPIAEDGKFRYIMFDMDGSFSSSDPFNLFASKKNHTFHELYDCDVKNITQEIKTVTIFLNLLNNNNFRRHFVDAFCIVAGSVFEPTRCETVIRQLTNRIYSMQILANGYGKTDSPWVKANQMIASFKGWAAGQFSALKNYGPMKLSNITPQQVTISSNQANARILINGQVIPTGEFSGTLFPPITLKAEAPAGFQFVGWTNRADAINKISMKNLKSNWNYYDQGSLDETEWYSTEYDASGWKNGKAPLGYAKDNSKFNTQISYGGDASNKYPCYYFRTEIQLRNAPSENESIIMNYIVDDGMVVYVNGTEAGRYNMPDGRISFNTFSVNYSGDNPAEGTLTLDKNLFKAGKNVIAVEIHNNNLTSSDIHWDGAFIRLQESYDTENLPYASTEEEWSLPTGIGVQELTAHFAPKEQSPSDYTNAAPVVINEISAANSIYVNEFFKKKDWIELYNTTAEDIDLAGMFLSDNENNPGKYVITGGNDSVSTIIPAYGYKVIWCDNMEPTSQLHARFKLSNEDGQRVVLTGSDMTWADTLIYCTHDGTETVGRFPDGSEKVYLMTRPTISTSNQMNSYTTKWEVPDSLKTGITEVTEKHIQRMGALSIVYAQEELLLRSEETSDVRLRIYTINGAMVQEAALQLAEPQKRINVSHLPKGIYLGTLSDNDGNECTVKFRIR